MGFLNKVFRLFGKDKSKAKPTSSPDKAIQELKGTSEVPESKAKQTSLDKAIRKLKGTKEVPESKAKQTLESKAKQTSSPDKAIQELKGTEEVPESKAKKISSQDKAIRKLKGTEEVPESKAKQTWESKARQTSSPDQAIQKLKCTEEVLLKQQKVLEKKMEQELAVARMNAKTNRRRAQQALKRKNHYANRLYQSEGTLATVQQQIEALESARMNSFVLESLGASVQALKKAKGNITEDRVNDVMDDIAEEQKTQRDIQEALSNPLASQFDEEELEAELQELLDQEEQDILSKLPEVPSYLPPQRRVLDYVEVELC